MINIDLNNQAIFSKSNIVETYATSYFGTLKVSDIFRNLQEIASLHSDSMKIGFNDLKEMKGGWVLAKQHLDITELPKAMENYTIHTWSKSLNKLYAIRNFSLRDANNREIAFSTSTWVLINLESRRLIPLTKLPMESVVQFDDNVTTVTPKIKLNKSSLVNSFKTKIRFSDIDINGHFNNTRYVDLTIDSIAEYFLEHRKLLSISTNFLHEGKFGDEIEIFSYMITPDEYHHLIYNITNDYEMFKAVTKWN
ncbi:MAG: hypothetical protein B6226_03255 [Candidatus Cloacimonetes bacterium 4572_65]|nr:MAG: hypothetical protein B6226_03255 [Candidatus Cloacimonetes bacterium 4572_65]